MLFLCLKFIWQVVWEHRNVRRLSFVSGTVNSIHSCRPLEIFYHRISCEAALFLEQKGLRMRSKISKFPFKLSSILSLFQLKNPSVLQTKKVKSEVLIFPKAEFESDKKFTSLSEEFEILTATIEQLKKSIRR